MTVYTFAFLLFCFFLSSCCWADGIEGMSDFTGIQYTEEGRAVGLPLGGIGAGCIEISSKGTFIEFANLNNWVARVPSIPGTGLWITYTQDGKTQAFSLGEGRVNFEGNFPFAKLTFSDLPVDVTLWCWSPSILHDLRRSAYPVAIFDAEFKNRSDKPAEVGLVLSYGTDYSAWLRQIAASHAGMASNTGFHEWETLRNSAASAPLAISIASASRSFSSKTASGISFNTQARVSISDAEKKRQKERREDLEKAYLRSYTFSPVDIRNACNRSYLNGPFGSDEWHKPINFRDVKPGLQEVYNIPFNVLDDAACGQKSIMMAGPKQELSSVTTKIDQKADCLFFLGNLAGWAVDGTCEYRIQYTDGSLQVVPLRAGFEISDYYAGPARFCPESLNGTTEAGVAYSIRVFAVPTDSSKEIATLEVRKTGNMSPIIFAITAGRLSETPLVEGIRATRLTDLDKMTGDLNMTDCASNTDADYSLVARTDIPSETHTYFASTQDALAQILSGSLLAKSTPPKIYAVEQRVKLAPNASGVAGLLCSWYAPNHRNLEGHVFGHRYEDWFADSSAVAEEIAANHDQLLKDTKRHFDIIAKSTLPKWYREMLQSNFYLGPSATWLTRDGITFTYESADRCPAMGTMDLRYYCSFQKMASYPELEYQELREFALSQTADGFILHDLGVGRGLADVYNFPQDLPPEEPKTGKNDYDGYWLNLPIKFCLEVARDYQWTGNKDFLLEMWPHVKRAIKWIQSRDYDHDGLPETYYSYDGWTMAGKSGYDANQWIALLVTISALADELGEPEYAKELRATHENALRLYLELFWTGKYFRQGVLDGGSTNDMVSSLQLAGDWYGAMLGFDTGVPKEKVKTALKTVDEICGGNAQHGVTVCLNPDGTDNGVWQCNVVGTGWSMFFASHCMYEGLDDVSLRIAKEVWQDYMVDMCRVPWRQEEVIENAKKSGITDRLLRDYRLAVIMTLSYSAAGLQWNVPKGTAAIRPAEWVWKDSKFVLPILMPTWLGQVACERSPDGEKYTLTNIETPIALKSLLLRTSLTGTVKVTHSGKTTNVEVKPDGTVEVGPVTLSERIDILIGK